MAENVPISKISVHELGVISPLASQISKYSEMASDSPEKLPKIKLAKISKKLYVLSHLDVFYGIKKSGAKTADAEIISFESQCEFLVSHVKQSKSSPGYNPLLLYAVVEFLSKNGIMSYDKSLELLRIQNRTEQKILDLKLSSDAVYELCLFYRYLAENLSSCTIPYYILNKISQHEKFEHLNIAKKIIRFIKIKKISDSTFVWPSSKSIDNLLPVSANASDDDDDSKIIFEKDDVPEKKDVVFAEKILRQSKQVFVIPATKKHPPYLINKKTNTVSIAHDKESVITLVDMPTVPLYTISKKMTAHLKLHESLDDVSMGCFDNKTQVMRYLKKHPDSKIVVLTKKN